MEKYIIVLFHCFKFKAIIKMQKIMVEETTKFSHIDILIGRVLYEFLETTNDKGISCISKITSTVEKVFILGHARRIIIIYFINPF